MEGELPQLKEDLKNAKEDREEQRQGILDEANEDMGDYDPAEGPPMLPGDDEHGDDSTAAGTGDDSTGTDGSDDAANTTTNE